MFKISYKKILFTVASLTVTSSLMAADSLITFDANTTAKASEVNANFITLQTGINNNTSRLTTAESDITAAETDITALSTSKQNRVNGTCGVGQVISAINADGSVICKADIDTDTNTVYSASSGINLVGTTFSIDTNEAQQRVSGTCAVGQSIRAISSTGTVTCEVDTDTNTDSAGVEYKYYTSYSNFPTDGSIITLVYITVTAPSAGYIYLTASGMFTAEHIEGSVDGMAAFGIMEDATNPIDTYYAGQSYREQTESMIRPQYASWTYMYPFFTNRVAIVSSAGSYTYYFRAQRTQLDVNYLNVHDMSMRNASLTGIFVPKKY